LKVSAKTINDSFISSGQSSGYAGKFRGGGEGEGEVDDEDSGSVEGGG
jgi:hypothetical protein